MIGDPNWLYSTIAQSSAAIVAIIGGFITASVLTLTAEKRNLTNQLKEKKIHLKTLKHVLEKRGNSASFAEELGLFDKRDIFLIESEITSLESRIRTFSYPNLGWGVITLAFLALFGVLSPILIIAYEASSHPWAKIYTMVTF